MRFKAEPKEVVPAGRARIAVDLPDVIPLVHEHLSEHIRILS